MSASTWLISLGLGGAFGFLLQRVQASSPDRIIGTLTLKDLTILKFMILAIGTGAIGIGILTALGLAHLNIKALPLLAVAGGGLIFGVGFGLGGYCPGTCLVGAAEGRRDALFTIGGGLLGALAYAAFSPVAEDQLLSRYSYGQATLASVSGLGPSVLGVLFGVAMIALALLLPTHPGKAVA
ncbi:MAG: YeeE/YedE family protein [Myxococcota bacterium]|nr:YeeE/YedE family protein [Myxococcota bacterium]